jgi:F-type H+-transporting ATPase subunit a
MTGNSIKVATVARFIISCLLLFGIYSSAQAAEPGFRPDKVIMEHISDAHDWHFFTINNHPVVWHLPVILYVPKQGFTIFSSAKFEEGRVPHDGFQLLTEDYIEKYHLDPQKYLEGHIIAVHADGSPNLDKPVYDLSLTRNVIQMMLAAALMIFLFTGVAKRYQQAPHQAPHGWQNAIEPFVLFIRDDVARAFLGDKAEKYLPYLLTVFFFIWINALLGLIPGSANVPGNIAFTGVLALITLFFIVISSTKAYWGHMLWPPDVPIFVKFILIPVEILSFFTKPFALMIRLFANMLAGHLIIISILSLIFIFGGLAVAAGWGFSIVSVAFTVFMYFVELLVGLIQAYIFASLSALFISQAFETGHHHGSEEEAVI